MKTFTREAFLALPFSLSPATRIDHNFEDRSDDNIVDYEDGKPVTEPDFESWAAGDITLTAPDGTEVGFGWMATGGRKSFTEAYQFDIDRAYDEPVLPNARILDEDGDVLSGRDEQDVLEELLAKFDWHAEVQKVLPALPAPEDIDYDQETAMPYYTVERDNDRDLRFEGEIIATANSQPNNAAGNYSGTTGRWSELRLYKTRGGKFICEQIGHTQWQGERTRYSGAVCDTPDEVIDFFGNGWLAKQLYAEGGIDATLNIE